MKKIQFTGLLLTVMLLSSCSALKQSSPFRQITKGMTQQEVLELCREPRYKRFDQLGEEWEYNTYISAVLTIVIVNFEEGRVVALDMFEPYKQPTATDPTMQVMPPLVGVQRPEQPMHRPNRPGHGSTLPGRVMSDSEFSAFYSSVRSGYSSDRLKTINSVNQLTSAQCMQLVELFTFSDEKIEALIAMYPKVADKQNYEQVIKKLPFTANAEKVRAYIEQYNNNNR